MLDFNWGASMRKYRRKSILDFNYSGHFFEYFSNTKYSSQDHSLAAGYTQQVSPRFTFGVRETAGLYSNTYSVLNSTAIADVSNGQCNHRCRPQYRSFRRPYLLLYDYAAPPRIQYTERLSFSLNGAYFAVNRDSQYLANTTGDFRRAGTLRTGLTARQTLGLYYGHSQFSYTKILR